MHDSERCQPFPESGEWWGGAGEAGLRSGATLASLRRFDHLLYVSCNPDTLADNLAALHDDYRITRFGLFDQFPYTGHMECAVALARR